MFTIYANNELIYDPLNPSYYLFSPKLKLEFGKAGSLEFQIPPDNVYYRSLKQLKTIITVQLDNVEIFRGRVLSIETAFNNLKTVYCEGDLAYLMDSVQKAEKYDGTTHALFNKIITAHNARVEAYKRFTVGNVTVENRSIKLTGQSEDINTGNIDYKQIAINSVVDNWNSTYDCIQDWIIDYEGGYLRTRYVNGTTYLDLIKDTGSTAVQEIEFGKNLLDLTQELNSDDLFTVLVPLGDDNLTIKSVNNNSDEIIDEKAVQEYGRIVRTQVFHNVNQASTLLENGRRFLAEKSNIPVSITVKAVDMHLIDASVSAIKVGDRVHINSSPHKLVEYLTCTEIEYDFENPENNTYTFGNPKQTLTQRYREDKRKQEDTYSSGGAGGGVGGAGGAAGAAAEEGEKEAEEVKQQIYDEWIDIDPNNKDGIGSLGGLYRQWSADKVVLEQQVGINFNAQEGNINLGAMKTQVDENTRKTSENRAYVDAQISDTKSELTLLTSRINDVDDKETEHYAELKLWADDKESVIEGKADKIQLSALQLSLSAIDEEIDEYKNVLKRQVGIDLDASSGNINIQSLYTKTNELDEELDRNTARIETVATDTQSQINIVTSNINQTNNRVASIQLQTDSNTSAINLKADKVTVNADLTTINGKLTALEGDINILKAKEITADELSAKIGQISVLRVNNLIASGSVTAPSIYVSGRGETSLVATYNYVNDKLGKIGSSGAAGNEHYHILTENQDGTISIGYATKTPQSFRISATRAYQEGVAAAAAAVRITELDRDEHFEDTYNTTTHATTVHLQALASNGNTKGANILVSGSRAYQDGYSDGASAGTEEGYADGVASVNITSVSSRAVPGTGTEYYNSSTHTTSLYGRATASNNHTYDFTLTTSTAAYDDGVANGAAGVTLTSLTRQAGRADWFSPITHQTYIYAIATASNNETIINTFATDTEAYDTGYNSGYSTGQGDGYNSVRISLLEQTGQVYNTGRHTTSLTIKATANNGKVKSEKFETNTTAYDTGFGAVTVNVSSTHTRNKTNKTVTVYSNAKASNNAEDSTSRTISVEDWITEAVGNVTASLSKTSSIVNASTKKVAVSVMASLSNGNRYTADYNIDASAIAEGVTVSVSKTSQSVSADTKKVTMTVKATASNGKTDTATYTADATSIYNAGYRSGKSDVTLDIRMGSSKIKASKLVRVTATATASNDKSVSKTTEVDVSDWFSDGGVTTIYVAMISGNEVSLRAYHPDGGYSHAWLGIGAWWDGY